MNKKTQDALEKLKQARSGISRVLQEKSKFDDDNYLDVPSNYRVDEENMDNFIEDDEELLDKEYREVDDNNDEIIDTYKNQTEKHGKAKKEKEVVVKVNTKIQKKAKNLVGDLFNNFDYNQNNDENVDLSLNNKGNNGNGNHTNGNNFAKNEYQNYNNSKNVNKFLINQTKEETHYDKINPDIAPNTFNKNFKKNNISKVEDDHFLKALLKNAKVCDGNEMDDFDDINKESSYSNDYHNNNNHNSIENHKDKLNIIASHAQKNKEIDREHNSCVKRRIMEDEDDEPIQNNQNNSRVKEVLGRTRVIENDENTVEKDNITASNSKYKISALKLGRTIDDKSITPMKDLNSINLENKYQTPSHININNNNNGTSNYTSSSLLKLNDNIANSGISLRGASNNEPLPIQQDGSFLFYWYDAYEEPANQFNPEPKVILFGKAKETNSNSYCSVSLVLKKLKRSIFLFPAFNENTATYSKVTDMLQEFKMIWDKKLPFKKETFDIKIVKKKYCFELPIKHGVHTVLKITFDAKISLPNEIQGKHFSCIFGGKSSLLDNTIIKIGLKGPGWVRVEKDCFRKTNPSDKEDNVTWCKHEVVCEDIKKISIDKTNIGTPHLKIFSFATKSALINGTKEIISICGVLKEKYEIEKETDNIIEGEDNNIMLLTRKIKGLETNISSFKELVNCNTAIVASSENTLINIFIQKLSVNDPDIIIGHGLYSNHLEILLNRITKLKLINWSKIGKLRRTYLPKTLQNTNNTIYVRNCFVGRLICDTFLSCRDILKETNYDIDFLSEKYLDKKYDVLETNSLVENTNTTNVEGILSRITKHCFEESVLCLSLMQKMKILQLSKELTNIAGNLWIKSLQNSRADRCEMFLMHEFIKQGYIIPDKLHKSHDKNEAQDDDDNEDDVKDAKNNKRKPQYGGGLVLEPKAGLYDNIVLLLDFNSLYPSIIQEYNICFTTVNRKPTEKFNEYLNVNNASTVNKGKKNKKKVNNSMMEVEGEDNNEEANEDTNEDKEETIGLENIDKSKEKAILPTLIEGLVSNRKKVKAEMKLAKNDINLYNSLDIKQKALKLSANSLYGYLGYKNSRFYAKPIAALITQTGRNILQDTVELVKNKHNLEVIYGDTDSIMIHSLTSNLHEALEIGGIVKRSINNKYRLLEMEIDGIFKTLLLLRKKKYACVKYAEPFLQNPPKFETEYKGLDLVRRDWCKLSKEVGKYLLNIILNPTGNKEDTIIKIYDFLNEVKTKMENGEYSLDYYTIVKQLTKKVEDYNDNKALPHVRVAKRLLKQGDTTIKPQTYIPYIICNVFKQEDNSLLTQAGIDVNCDFKGLSDRAFYWKEVSKLKEFLKPDLNWYKENQILAPVDRICRHIQEIDMFRLAECLGIDSKKYEAITNNNDNADDLTNSNKLSHEVIKRAKIPFTLDCLKCKEKIKIYDVSTSFRSNLANLVCKKCKSPVNDYKYLTNMMLLRNKDLVKKYYLMKKKCNKCDAEIRHINVKSCREGVCNRGMYYSVIKESDVVKDLAFNSALFKNRTNNTLQTSEKTIYDSLNSIRALTEKVNNNIAYNDIDLTELFNGVFI